MIRRTVPNDNSCLFYAIAYCCEGAEASKSIEQRLRKVVADTVLADPDQETRALLLGMPTGEYATWIMNTHHWGGEGEIVILAEHYKVEIAVVSCESMRTLVYGQGPSATLGRIYILYTGQHYDPLVGASDASCPTSDEVKVQPLGDNPELEESAIAIARQHVQDAARKAAQRRVKKIKCGGCGVLLDTNAAFQEHCMDENVQHGDDFSFECEEIEIVYEGDDSLPEGTIDLNDASKVYPFYNQVTYTFSNTYPAKVELDGVTYPTAEHAWLCMKYVGTAPDLQAKIQQADLDSALALSNTEGFDRERPDWSEVRYDALVRVMRAKFQQHPQLMQELLATGDRLLVAVELDEWAGMSAAGGIPKGENSKGKALMHIREAARAP